MLYNSNTFLQLSPSNILTIVASFLHFLQLIQCHQHISNGSHCGLLLKFLGILLLHNHNHCREREKVWEKHIAMTDSTFYCCKLADFPMNSNCYCLFPVLDFYHSLIFSIYLQLCCVIISSCHTLSNALVSST